jgi:hypothetical protein
MKRTTIFLTEELHERLRNDAFQSRISMAELIRNRLEEATRPVERAKSGPDPIVKVAGVCRGPAFSNDIDEALYGE